MSYYPPPLPPTLSGPGGVVDAQGVVAADLPCRKCSYNLRGLPVDSRCPECGRAVGLSVNGDLLRFSDPAWVRTLKRGVRLIIWGIVVIVLGSIVVGVVGAALGGAPAFAAVMILVPLAGYLLMLAGTWLLTEPDPSGIGEDAYGTSRRLIRITLVLGVINQVIEIVQQFVNFPPLVANILLFLTIVFAIAGVVNLFAQLQYLKKLALRIPDLKLAGRAHFLMYALGIGYGLFALVGGAMAAFLRFGPGGAAGPAGSIVTAFGCSAGVIGLAVVVFAIMFLLMLERMGKRFGEEASVAEETWARAAVPAAPV